MLVTTILFRDRPALAAAAFLSCYLLGMLAAVVSALIARRTILKGRSRPMALELPTYKLPSVRTALMTTYDRGFMFLKNAGGNIMMICIVLWWLGSYPHVSPPRETVELREKIAAVEARGAQVPADEAVISFASPTDPEHPEQLTLEEAGEKADQMEASHAKAMSFMGRVGRTVEPVFRPLGFDWQLTVGVLASFAAREVFAGTMGVVLAGDEDFENNGVRERLRLATRDDGKTPVFTKPTCWALLVFFVLAMQCLPTLAVTAREAGHVKWALLQLVWMTVVAYVGAMIAYALAGGWT